MKRILVCILSVIMLLSCVPISSFAATPETVEPLWVNTGSITTVFSFIGTSGSAETHVVGHAGVTKITGTIKIYRQSGASWVYVTEGTKTANTRSFLMAVPVTGIIGEYYKADFTFEVYKDGIVEIITKTAYSTCD